MYQMIKDRDNRIGLPELHPHQLRHAFSHGRLANAGSESEPIRLAGWKTRAMLTANPRALPTNARDAHRRLSLGDRF
jgi:integrase